MKALTVRLFFSAVLLVVVLGACTENGGSIYYILEHEKKQPDSNIGKYITIADIAKNGTTYYAAAGAIFVGSSASGSLTWLPKHKLTLPTSDALCNALAFFGGNLYGGFITPGGNLGLYKAVGDDFSSGGPVTDSLFTLPTTHQVIRLISAGGRLLIVTALSTGDNDQPFDYYLTSYDGAAYARLLSDIPVKINDATFDGVNYWAVAENKLYSGTALPLGWTSTLGIPISEKDTLNGVTSISPTEIYVSAKKSGLYIYNGTTWANSEEDDQGGDNVSYQGISRLLSGTVIVGSNGYGLYYYKPGFVELERSDDSDMITLDLYDASITRFLVDTNIVLACTNGKGLWRGNIDSSNVSGVSGWDIQ